MGGEQGGAERTGRCPSTPCHCR